MLKSLGGRKFVLAVLVIVFAMLASFFVTDQQVRQKWLDMALIVVGFYFGYKAAERKPDSNEHNQNRADD